MKITHYILMGSIALAAVACNNEHTHADGEAHHQNEEQAHQEAGHDHEEEGLHLNHGEKWPVNEATQVGMEKMQEIIAAFKAAEQKNYKALGDSLSAQSNYIISNCDMTGEPHNQLHVVLHPMLDEIGGLRDGNESVEQMEMLLNDYFKHFEYKN